MESNKNIKKALDHNVPEWDDSALWNQIEESLPAEKPRRRIFWWLFSSVGMAFIGLVLILTLNPSPEKVNFAKDQSQVISKQTQLSETDDITTKSIESSSTISQPQSTSNLQATVVKNSNQSKPNNHLNSTAATKPIASRSEAVVDNHLAKTHTLSNNNNTSIDQTRTQYSLPQTQLSNIASKQTVRIPLEQTAAINSLTFIPNPTTINPNISITPEYTSQSFENSTKTNEIQDALLIDFGIYRTLRSISAPDYSDWATIKDEQESQLETVDFNLQYQRSIYRNIHLGIGVGYSQINERLTWRDTMVATMDTTYTTSIKSVRTTSNVLQIETPNAYQSVYIPLSVSYVNTINKWMYSANVGADISLFSYFKGRYLNTDLDDLSSVENRAEILNNSIGIQSLTASINVGYQLKEGIYLTAGLRGKYGIQNRLADSSTYLGYHNYGVQIGLRCNLE
jgi:hypothetical protein